MKSLENAPARKIEQRLLTENRLDYVVGGLKNWSLLRKHVQLYILLKATANVISMAKFHQKKVLLTYCDWPRKSQVMMKRKRYDTQNDDARMRIQRKVS